MADQANWWQNSDRYEQVAPAQAQPQPAQGQAAVTPGFIPFNTPPMQQALQRAQLAHTQAEANNANLSGQLTTQKLAQGQADQADAARQQLLRNAQTVMGADNVLNAIKEAQSYIKNNSSTTGMPGAFFGHIPGTDAYSLNGALQTVGGNVAFDSYRALKENLPQGAQGGVRLNQGEIELLKSLQGNLRQGLPAPVLEGHLHNIDQKYRIAAAQASGLDPNAPDVRQQLGIDPLQPDSMVARTMGIDPNMSAQAAQHALNIAQTTFAQRTANLTRNQQQVGLTQFNADPRVQMLRSIIAKRAGQSQPQAAPQATGTVKFLGFE